ncbi:hypothetical protein AWC32_02220 [Mycobacterium xenopi]|nr:hypothetical protein AWC32_02220 [Mycobacterium xenopi]
MAGAAEGAVSAGQLQSGLAALESSDALVLLRIADYGARGLTGPEFAEGNPTQYGNFIKLCRLDLFSGKDKTSGGSFGLGKAVYWRFSRLQTVIFNSTISPEEAVNSRWQNRLLGVNQGVVHQINNINYQGRGFFGAINGNGYVASVWDHQELVDALKLRRHDSRPGTSALLVGFYDPDEPEKGMGDIKELESFAKRLGAAIEEDFWPLLTRKRLRVRTEVLDGDELVLQHAVDPADQYAELVRALNRFDAGDVDDTLEEVGSVVVRDVPIAISARIDAHDPHPAFEHTAKLVVTLSDDEHDSLENKVCLLRRPEMVVQTVDREFEGRTYHAFLLAGAAIRPDNPSIEDERADDFLRFAEPPAHDRWIPRRGRNQTSQANLTAHYRAPWVPNLQNIESSILDRLFELFGAPPVSEDQPPEAIFRNLSFLRGEVGTGARGASAARKPDVRIQHAHVANGAWHLIFEIRAKNRPEGWEVVPKLAFVGLDGGHVDVDWASFEAEDDAETGSGGEVILRGKPRGRLLKTTVRAVSVSKLPIPASESAVDVRLARASVAPPPLKKPEAE